ncbi:MAG: hypothetical protein ACXADL_07155 [Candidatus Thorarchaeota archaeon]
MKPGQIRLHRLVSWILALLSLATIAAGYSLARGWIPETYTISLIHRVLEISFIGVLVLHVWITLAFYKLNWRNLFEKLRSRRGTRIHLLRLLQRTSSWLIVLFAMLMIIPGLNGYPVIAAVLEDAVPFGLHRVFDFALAIVITIHFAVGLKFFTIRKRLSRPVVNVAIIGMTLILLMTTVYLENASIDPPETEPPVVGIKTVAVDYRPFIDAYVRIGDVQYGFDSSAVLAIRTDIFQYGEFSMFDVVTYIASKGVIDLEYHFEESMNTYLIDSINGTTGWWYSAHYSGGWYESLSYRMDHHHWKPGSRLSVFRTNDNILNRIYTAFSEEIPRLEENNGSLIIPEVKIDGFNFSSRFENVAITAHNLRSDIFKPGVITGIDVIMTLGDLGLITYELQWYDTIGTAEIVRNYFVTSINGNNMSGTCGFVYESGSHTFSNYGNHIHIPSDSRPMNSPEYALWFWICI